MRTAYPEKKKTEASIPLLLVACMLVCGVCGFGFYKMLQPQHIGNPGLAAYKPFPGTVIQDTGTTKTFTYAEAAPTEGTSEKPSDGTPDQTTGRPTQALPAPAEPVRREATT
jgi:hypothetical protein